MVIDQYYLNLFRLWTQKEQYHEWFFLDECRVLNWVIDSVLKATKVEETFKQKLVNIICQLVLESTKAAEHEKLGGALTDQVGSLLHFQYLYMTLFWLTTTLEK